MTSSDSNHILHALFCTRVFQNCFGVCIEKVGNNTSKRQYDMIS